MWVTIKHIILPIAIFGNMYLIKSDYRKSIQDVNLNQIISSNDSILAAAELTAQEEAMSYLRQKYDVDFEFTNTKVWSITEDYTARARVYLDAPAYSTVSTYALDDLMSYCSKVYKCTTAITTGEELVISKWELLGPQYTIYHAKYPNPLFNYKKQYKKDDKVYWLDRSYTCKIDTSSISHELALQYGNYSNLPIANVFPDDIQNGEKYWTPDNDPYVLDAGTELTDTDYWTKSDNRNQQMVTYLIDMTLYYIHARLAPNNLPQIRIDRYTNTIQWLMAVGQGNVTSSLPLLQPTSGNRIRYGGNIKNQNSY